MPIQQQIQTEPLSHQLQQQRPQRPEGRTLHQQQQREEYVELQKRESDI